MEDLGAGAAAAATEVTGKLSTMGTLGMMARTETMEEEEVWTLATATATLEVWNRG